MEKKTSKLIWITTLICIFLFSVGLLLLPKKEYSPQENRYLESFPKLTLETLTDGSFMQDFETYVCDHFPLRDAFMTLQTWYQRILGRNQINGIYLCSDDYYIEEYKTPENTSRIISVFSRLEENVVSADVTFMLVPTAVTVYADKLPSNAKNANQTEEIDRIYSELNSTTVELTPALLAAREQYPLYYRLDHHWTTYGAYFAYAEYCKAKNIIPYSMDSFSTAVVSSNFQGTIYSKLNDFFAGSDEIVSFSTNVDNLSVFYPDTNEISSSLYAEEYLSTKDQYSYFLDNIHPLVEITNPGAESASSLVVIKDSYANCMIPFLVNHYQKIYVFDTRYYKNSVSEFINNHVDVTDVLVLYNMNTIDTDLGIGGIY